MWKRALIFFFSCCFFSCGVKKESSNSYTYHDDGTAKPKIALVPIIDSSESDLPWDLSEEFTEAIESRLKQSEELFLTQDFEILGKNPDIFAQINPFFEDMNWLYESNSVTEFIVFIELVNHKLIPKEQDARFFSLSMGPQFTLEIAFRVKVVDIRKETPKVVLQEILEDSFPISWRLASADYGENGFSKTAFFLSPIGSAHLQMIKKISQQVQDYILLAKRN